MSNHSSFSIDDVYGPLGPSDADLDAAVLRSLQPRGPDMLYDALAAHGLDASHHVLDIGSRDAVHACALAARFGCQILAVDPIPHHLDRAHAKITATGQHDRVRALTGRIEAIPAADGAFDFIWCRDVLIHVADLTRAFSECRRVLKPGGKMLIYATFATDLLEPREAARLFQPLAVVPANTSAAYVEAQWQAAGLRTILRDEIGSEWRERWEEDGTRTTATQLLKIAHLRRDRDNLLAELGEKNYHTELADCHWGVYQMLGKLCPTLYIVERPHP